MIMKWTEITSPKKLKRISIVIASAVIVYGIFIIGMTWPIDTFSMEKSGLFGDSFGVVTCFFTACGFIGLLYNLSEQRLFNSQQQINAINQSFENNFFQMLSHLNEITKDIDYVIKEEDVVVASFFGRSALTELHGELKDKYAEVCLGMMFDSSMNDEKLTRVTYNKFWASNNSKLGHYFRWLYNILKYIDKSDTVDQYFYANLLTAQLSNQELLLLYYNAAFDRGRKFQYFIKKYNMMSNLEPRILLDENHIFLIKDVKFWHLESHAAM